MQTGSTIAMVKEIIAKELIPIFGGIIVSIISSIISYKLGKRAKIDTEKIKRKIHLSEEIGRLLQEVMEMENYFYEFYGRNFGNVASVEEAVENFFERRGDLFEDEYKMIHDVIEKRNRLREKLLLGRLYLPSQFVDEVAQYLDLSTFHYLHDGGYFESTFYVEFFRNIMDEQLHKQRKRLQKLLLSKLKKLV